MARKSSDAFFGYRIIATVAEIGDRPDLKKKWARSGTCRAHLLKRLPAAWIFETLSLKRIVSRIRSREHLSSDSGVQDLIEFPCLRVELKKSHKTYYCKVPP